MSRRRRDEFGAEPRAGAVDLAVGMAKAYRQFFVGLLVVAVFIAFLAYGANRPADPTFTDATAGAESTTTTSGLAFEQRKILVGDRCLNVEVADTPEKRAQGLKHRDSLGEINGMVFLFEQPVMAAFTMSEVRIPLTIGFYDDAGMRVDTLDMEPCAEGSSSECPRYESKSAFRNALEVERGQLPEGPLVMSCPEPAPPPA